MNGAEVNIKEKLEIIRSIVSLGSSEDIALFNYWAKKACCPEIELDSKKLL